jgi:hypothetical protein
VSWSLTGTAGSGRTSGASANTWERLTPAATFTAPASVRECRGPTRCASDSRRPCISPEQRVPLDHPLRPIPVMVDRVLPELSPELAKLYSPVGRPSIPPEKLVRALLLQVLYSTRREPLLMEFGLQPAVSG